MQYNSNISLDHLHDIARSGDPEAQFYLARLFDQQGRHDVAVGWLERSAEAGYTPSMSYLGARLVIGRAAPWAPERGAALIRKLADTGDADAANRLALLYANGVGVAQDWTEALAWLKTAADRKAPGAADQLALIGEDIEAWPAPAPVDEVRSSPWIRVVRGFISPAVCRRLIEGARGRLKQTGVYQTDKNVAAPDMRTNSGAGFALFDGDVLLALVRARLAATAGAPMTHLEAANVLHYAVGQSFDHHFDFLNPAAPGFAQMVAREGQRTVTVLIYLNDDYEGGETDFPELDYRFRGAPGDALFFHNVDESGAVDPRTVHAGLPPTRGEKWVLSQWIRSRPQPVV